MAVNHRKISRYVLAVFLLALPVILLYNSVRSFRELNETKSVYLRNHAATLAARLENLDPGQLGGDPFDLLSAEEPALVDLKIYDSPAQNPGDPILGSLWRGEALFHMGTIDQDGDRIFRVYTPFHVDGQLHIARIDLAADAADFLVAHTRRNVMLSVAASVAMILFTAYFLWSEHRAARFQRRQLELEHLAHLGEMSAVLAHEIRNPLGTIKGFVQLALEQAGDEIRGLLLPVLEETGRLEKLVKDLLLYGRPRTPDIRPASWRELSEQLRAHAVEAIGTRPIRFTTDGSLTELKTDPDLLSQILLNLILNSIDAVAGEPAGEVSLGAGEEPGRWFVTVEDNGPGIPEEVRDKLFEPFLTTKSNGTGLGLSIAKKLTETLGGQIKIQPRVPRGTRAELAFMK